MRGVGRWKVRGWRGQRGGIPLKMKAKSSKEEYMFPVGSSGKQGASSWGAQTVLVSPIWEITPQAEMLARA